eukprot:CAMPEP_0116131450 /NCGR_PEP_ID=MMETSP0329-20121206/9010_1 /TAXON_ID=697910 /ORGANISM="Pseudo-nitzschia arenysensis, Strain B593" /LENGTH=212 /DNA_ID=CAMNT_0003625877 /DNA_START=260 /DNA_END=898 /DNA_ORIENTATION=+
MTEIDTSIRTEDLFALVKEEDGSTKETNSSKEISIDLDNMLQELEHERSSGQLRLSNVAQHNADDICSLSLDDCDCEESHCDHIPTTPQTPQHQHMNGHLRFDDLPSPSVWWGSSKGSSFQGSSFMGSFRKKMNNSLKLFPYKRRSKDASGKAFSTSSDAGDEDNLSPGFASPSSRRKKKVVKFKKFDTIFPFYKSFSKLQRQPSEDEGSHS